MAVGSREGRAIAEAKLAELLGGDWEDVDAHGRRVDEVQAPSGRVFRVKSHVFWDMADRESDLLVSVKVYAVTGWRRYRPYRAFGKHGGELPPRPS